MITRKNGRSEHNEIYECGSAEEITTVIANTPYGATISIQRQGNRHAKATAIVSVRWSTDLATSLPRFEGEDRRRGYDRRTGKNWDDRRQGERRATDTPRSE